MMRGRGSISDALDDPPMHHDARDRNVSAGLPMNGFLSLYSTLAVDGFDERPHRGRSMADRA